MRKRLALFVVLLTGVAVSGVVSGPALGACLPLVPCKTTTSGSATPPPPATNHRSKLIGMSDNEFTMFSSPYFRALGVGPVRLVVPWDQEIKPHPFVTNWLAAAKPTKRPIFVVFGIAGCATAKCSPR